MTREAARSLLLMDKRTRPGRDADAHDDPLSALVEMARDGDADAFEQVMVCTQHKVAATAWRFLGNREDARDATQEVFLRAFKYLKSYKAGHDFHGWLYRIAVNVCRDMLREGRRGMMEELDIEKLADAPEGRRVNPTAQARDAEGERLVAQQRAIVRRALETLPLKERAAVVLRDLEGLPTEEVARLLNSRPATVRSQISTARVKIKVFCDRFIRDRQTGRESL